MSHDVITQVRIKGWRVFDDITLDVAGLTVLIGDNGTGKSTIFEALEILRRVTERLLVGEGPQRDLLVRLRCRDGLRAGADRMTFGVRVDGVAGPLDYDVTLAFVGTTPPLPVVVDESFLGAVATPAALARITDALRRVTAPSFESRVLPHIRADRGLWDRYLLRARAVLGSSLRDIVPESGVVTFGALRPPLLLSRLSQGQIAYLGTLAALELGSGRTLLTLDDAEAHLHPDLVTNLVQLLEHEATQRPVLVSTHSDRFLDALSSPADSAVLCDLGPDGAARLRRPDPDALARWLERYPGLGTLRAAGNGPYAFGD